MTLRIRRTAPRIAALVGSSFLISATAWAAMASASVTKYSATDQISASFEIAVTSPRTHVTWPSVVLVAAATLTTSNPDGSGVQAPPGEIYLSVQWSSAPINRPITDPNWGNYFSNITPISASAVSYLAASGRRYGSVRINPVNQIYSMGPQDGLVDATYYFTVPISNRRGAIMISPCSSIGTEYQNASGMNTGVVDIGGPTRIPVSFPARLTPSVTKSRTPVRASFEKAAGSSFYVMLTLLFGGVIVYTSVKSRTRRTNFGSRPQPAPSYSDYQPPPARPRATPNADEATVQGAIPKTGTPTAPAAVIPPEPASQPPAVTPEEPTATRLSVDVLGPLVISPTLASPSDPIRAIVAYLALHDERPVSLDEIQTALWPVTNDSAVDIKRSSMGNYMTDTRRYIGVAHFPSAAGQPGYRLVDVHCDWRHFEELVKQSASRPPGESRDLRRQALGLVRGQPFAGDTSRYFTWAFSMTVVYEMVGRVVETAHVLSRDFVLAGDLTNAEAVLRQGLLIDPSSTTLWEDLTDVVLESTDASLLTRHWQAAEVTLGNDAVALLKTRATG